MKIAKQYVSVSKVIYLVSCMNNIDMEMSKRNSVPALAYFHRKIPRKPPGLSSPSNGESLSTVHIPSEKNIYLGTYTVEGIEF